MDLFEYQGKQYFARYDIPVSPGGPADTVEESVRVAESAGYPVVVKAQVQVGGRGKAGGIKLAENADEVRTHAGNILGMDIKGHVVRRLWIEHASDIAEEYYASFTLDRAAKKHLLMLSAQGGVDIVTAGTSDNRVFELFSTQAFEEFLRDASAKYDLVLLDVPPVVVAGDALTIANRVDGTVLVVRAFQEQRGLVQRIVNQLGDVRAQLVGVVLNRPRNTAGGYLRKNYEAMAAYAGK